MNEREKFEIGDRVITTCSFLFINSGEKGIIMDISNIDYFVQILFDSEIKSHVQNEFYRFIKKNDNIYIYPDTRIKKLKTSLDDMFDLAISESYKLY